MSKSKRVPQSSKRQREMDKFGRALVERSKSNAAGPHRLDTDYRRKPKHWKGWE